MKEEPFPYGCHVFVCTNKRDDGGRVACASHGRPGEKLKELLKKTIKDLGLNGRVRISSSGCMDVCEKGPNVMIFSPSQGETYLSGVQEADISEVVRLIQEKTAS